MDKRHNSEREPWMETVISTCRDRRVPLFRTRTEAEKLCFTLGYRKYWILKVIDYYNIQYWLPGKIVKTKSMEWESLIKTPTPLLLVVIPRLLRTYMFDELRRPPAEQKHRREIKAVMEDKTWEVVEDIYTFTLYPDTTIVYDELNMGTCTVVDCIGELTKGGKQCSQKEWKEKILSARLKWLQERLM